MNDDIIKLVEKRATEAQSIYAIRVRSMPEESMLITLDLPRSKIKNATTERLAREVNMDPEALAAVGVFDFLLREYGHWYDDLIEMTLEVILEGRSKGDFNEVRTAVERWFERNIPDGPVLS